MKVFLFSFFVALLMVGCGLWPDDGPFITYYKDGKKRAEGSYKDGKPDGLQTSWHENGQKESESNYKDGKLEWANEWYKNGQKELEGNYKDGNWVVDLYNDDGTEAGRQTYKDGKLID